MTTKILFGYITPKEVEMMESDGFNPFYDESGDAFDYVITIDEDVFRIKDSIGRLVPFAPENIEELYRAVKEARIYAKPIAAFEAIQTLLEENDTLCIY
jgi:hypothetical protein